MANIHHLRVENTEILLQKLKIYEVPDIVNLCKKIRYFGFTV